MVPPCVRPFALALAVTSAAGAQAPNRTVYWIDAETDRSDAIVAHDLATARTDTLVRATALGPDDDRQFFGLAVDVANGRLFWGNSHESLPDGSGVYLGPITRSRLDGTGPERFVASTSCGLGGVTDLEVDPDGQTLYWAITSDCLGSNISYADASGPPPDEWRTFPTTGSYTVRALEVDVAGNALYWADPGDFPDTPRGIYTAPLDDTTRDRRIVDALVCDLVVDPASASIFWTGCGDGVIRRSDLGGAATEVVLDAGSDVRSLALDRDGRRVYWSEAGTGSGAGAIRRANLDGTGAEAVVTGLARPRAVELGFGGYPTSGERGRRAAARISLHAVWPNPARSAGSVTFELAEPGVVSLAVFDAMGREVAQILEGPRAAGTHTAPFATDGLASGAYVVRLQVGADVAVRRFVVVR